MLARWKLRLELWLTYTMVFGHYIATIVLIAWWTYLMFRAK